MLNTYVIGIDIGSSSLKAAAIDIGSGKMAAVARSSLPYERRPDGGCELAAEAIHTAVTQVLGQVAQQLGTQARQVRAIACTGHGAGLYALDQRGQLIGGRAIASTDQRAQSQARALGQSHGAALFDEVGCAPWAGQPTVLAAHVLGQAAVRSGALHCILFAKDYLGLWLTGARATDASDASTAGLLNLARGEWSAQALRLSGIHDLEPRHFAPLLPQGTPFGTLLASRAQACGLPVGIPVAMGAIDLWAAMNAVAPVSDPTRAQAVAVFGTWCVNAVTGPVREPKPPLAAIVNHGSPTQRLYMENSPSSMANIAWATQALHFDDAHALMEAAMGEALGAQGLRFMPFVNGGGAHLPSAGFVGLQTHHTRAHLARAVVDAVAALHAYHLHRLAAQDLDISRLTVLGGGACDIRLVRLLAGLLGQTVQRCADDETGARGAALYAAQSQGLFAADRGNGYAASDSIEPDPTQATACVDFMGDFTQRMHQAAAAAV